MLPAAALSDFEGLLTSSQQAASLLTVTGRLTFALLASHRAPTFLPTATNSQGRKCDRRSAARCLVGSCPAAWRLTQTRWTQRTSRREQSSGPWRRSSRPSPPFSMGCRSRCALARTNHSASCIMMRRSPHGPNNCSPRLPTAPFPSLRQSIFPRSLAIRPLHSADFVTMTMTMTTLIGDGSNKCWSSGPVSMSDGVMTPRRNIGYRIEG